MPNKEECPALEEIATLAEGRLEGEARERLLGHLDQCESCFEVFAETSRFLLDEETTAPEKVPVATPETFSRARNRRSRLVWIGLAAAAVIVLVLLPRVGWWSWFSGPAAPLPSAPDLAATLDRPNFQLSGKLWPLTNPAAFVSRSPQAVAFQSGVLLLDLAVARREDDSARLQLLSARLRDLHAGAQWVAPSSLATVEGIHAAEQELSREQGFSFQFGKWAEASRLAAAGGNEAFFQQDSFRDFLDSVLNLDWPEPVRLQLQRIASLLEGQGDQRLVPLEQALTDLVALNL